MNHRDLPIFVTTVYPSNTKIHKTNIVWYLCQYCTLSKYAYIVQYVTIVTVNLHYVYVSGTDRTGSINSFKKYTFTTKFLLFVKITFKLQYIPNIIN